jgi:predicted acetyltransferase
MIAFGEEKYKPALKAMWKLCFPTDTDIFIDFYFDEVYKNEETLVYLENGKTAATFQMIPYLLKNGKEISKAGYISGAMTHPDFRQKGFMKKMLSASFDIMLERGFDYTFLIPQETWLFDFYEKFGYKTLEDICIKSQHHYEDKSRSNPITIPDCFASFTKTNTAIIYPIYQNFLSKIPQVVLKTEIQFKQILREFFNEKGILFANEEGIAFTFKRENEIVIKEFFYKNSKIKEAFLKVIRDYYSQEKIVTTNSSDRLTGSWGMIKRLNDEKPEISALYISMMLN